MQKDIKVYLCGPINGCTDAEASDWREEMKANFPEAIDPMKRDYRGVEEMMYREIVDLDKRDVRECNIVLVNYVKPSVGTAMEVFYAWTIGKPVVVWCKKDTVIPPWMRYHATTFVHSVDQVVAKICEIA